MSRPVQWCSGSTPSYFAFRSRMPRAASEQTAGRRPKHSHWGGGNPMNRITARSQAIAISPRHRLTADRWMMATAPLTVQRIGGKSGHDFGSRAPCRAAPPTPCPWKACSIIPPMSHSQRRAGECFSACASISGGPPAMSGQRTKISYSLSLAPTGRHGVATARRSSRFSTPGRRSPLATTTPERKGSQASGSPPKPAWAPAA